MNNKTAHTFHIPVMGLGFTIDTPVKVARFGISSVISIIEDDLMEKMRKYHSEQWNLEYVPILKNAEDKHATRITAYLNVVDTIVKKQVEQMRNLPFEKGNDLVKYFELLPEGSDLKEMYLEMIQTDEGDYKLQLQNKLRENIVAGSIDVNIMSKVDKFNYDKEGNQLASEYSDALSSLRGFGKSDLHSGVVFSAGYNPRLYAYAENFPDFFPDASGYLKKKIILKVSDYRSALVQSKLLAKKGLWVSEFRVESGLNCGGHAFATEGLLLGPILEEFKAKRNEVIEEMYSICNTALDAKGLQSFSAKPELKITVQGGIGTHKESIFLMEHYEVNATGWGSPFLLVPEATNVDEETLNELAHASKDDYYLSSSSPLGIPFNNFRKSSAEKQRLMRIEKGRPGSGCSKKFLTFDSEFSRIPICTASREYQHKKIVQLKEKNLSFEEYNEEFNKIVIKDCLCEGLGAAPLLKDGIISSAAVTICPGPNLAYFSNTFSLQQMVDHIYGRINILNSLKRPNMFVNELGLYVDYLKNEMHKNMQTVTEKQNKFFTNFKNNLLSGVEYYNSIAPKLKHETEEYINEMKRDLARFEQMIKSIANPPVAVVTC
jgi:hypothetical protein